MKAFLALLCLVSQILSIWMWEFPNCYDFHSENATYCCISDLRMLYKIKDARFVECLSSQKGSNEEMCEESFSAHVPRMILEYCSTTDDKDRVLLGAFGAAYTRVNGICQKIRFKFWG